MAVQQAQADPRFYRSTWDNVLLEDLSGGVVSGSVTHDTSRATHWTLDCTMTYDGWRALRPFVDWVSPVQNLLYPDGTTVSRQLGHYLVLDSPEQRQELGGTVRLDARDALWLLNAQGLATAIQVTGGSFGALARSVVAQTLVEGSPTGRGLRNTIPDITVPIRADTYRGFPVATLRLAVVNELLTTAVYYPVYTNQLGVLGTQPRLPLYDRAPLRSWYANPPSGSHFIGSDLVDLTPFVGQPSPVIGAVDTSPGSASLVDQIIVVSGVGGGTPITGSAKLNQFAPQQVPVAGTSKTITVPMVTSNASANVIALRILEELLTENTTISLTVKPDPDFVAIHAPARLGIWDLLGRPVAVGKFLVKRVRYGMTVDDPLMKVDLGALEDAIPA